MLVASEIYKQAFGPQTVEVKYKEPGAMANHLLSGQTSFVHISTDHFRAHIKEGRMRARRMSSAERMKSLPNIPSASEAGIVNSDITAWWSVHAPKGTPAPGARQAPEDGSTR